MPADDPRESGRGALTAGARDSLLREVELRRAAWQSLGAPREPWSRYTVEGLFEVMERAARTYDVVEVRYDPLYGFPAEIKGDMKIGRFDDWHWVTARDLTPGR